jgi:hypothetical protein
MNGLISASSAAVAHGNAQPQGPNAMLTIRLSIVCLIAALFAASLTAAVKHDAHSRYVTHSSPTVGLLLR